MGVPKLMVLLCCIYYSYASHHHSHTIPVEGYEAHLQNLGEHVDVPEPPVKVIKITKTIAVKIPVPYPVKVIQKVPYPVHVSKPYPVPVPQIIHVPAPTHKYGAHEGSNQGSVHDSPYQVHESANGHSSGQSQEQSFDGGNSGHNQYTESFAAEHPSEGSYGGSSYDVPSQNYYGNTGNHEEINSLESRNYDQAIQEYLNKVNAGNGGHSNAGGYH